MNELELDDEGFIRAPAALVYARLADPSGYPAWWPGLRLIREEPAGPTWDHEAVLAGPPRRGELEGRPPEPGDALFSFELHDQRWWRWRYLSLTARPYRFRPGKGLFYALGGHLEGTAEWWLEEGHGGTVVHHLTKADVARGRSRPVIERYRRAIRRGIWGLKDATQSEVRQRIGLHP